MSDQREVFTILEDFTTGAGVRLPARQTGDTVGDNHVPVLGAEDSGGLYRLLEVRDAGEASSGVNSVVGMISEDSAGNLQYLQLRDAGEAASGVDSLPALTAIDPSGNLQYLNLNADGELVISNQPQGTILSGNATHTMAALTTYEEVLAITLAAGEIYESLDLVLCATREMLWKVYNVDDYGGAPVETEIAQFLTGSGQYTVDKRFPDLQFTAGSTGVQKLVIKAYQLYGALTDAHATATVFQKA